MRRAAVVAGLALALLALGAAPALAAQTLSVIAGGTGSGTVTSSPAGIECGGTCQSRFADGAVVTLTAAPHAGSEAATWESCPGTVDAEGRCVVTMDGERSARVSFALGWRSQQPQGPNGRTYLGPVGDVECWAANRCLLITGGNTGMPAGIYAYDGSGWYLYSTVCGSSQGRIAWVGPDEFWTVSDPQAGQQSTGAKSVANSLCHFKDGAVVASYAEPNGLATSYLKMNAAACLGPEECWFGGQRLPLGAANVGAFHLYWNGLALDPVPSLTDPDPELEYPSREVTGLAYDGGKLYEGMRVQEGDEAPGEEGEPVFLHRVLPGAPAEFEPVTPAAPLDLGPGVDPSQLEGMRLADDGEGLWAAAGALDEQPGQLTVLRLTEGELAQLALEDPSGAFAGGDHVGGLGAEPGAAAAWVGYRLASERAQSTNSAHLALVHAGGVVEPRIDLPAEGEGVSPRGSAGPVACAGPEQCWMATSKGWLFHLGPDVTPNQDPAMHALITFRPADNSLPTVPPTSLPEDDSEANQKSNEEPLPEGEPDPIIHRRPAIYGDIHQRLVGGRVLELSFLLRVRAHVRLLAKRSGAVVARTPRYTMDKGRRSLRLRLDPKRWPTKLDLQVHEIKKKKGAGK
jgi:hypothetical protein